MKRRILVAFSLALGAAAVTGLVGCASAPPVNPNVPPPTGKGVYFIEPADGAVVSSPFKVKFGLLGMAVKPAGEQMVGTGHHHLLINQAGIEAGQIIPVDETHIHFGKGQTETELKLPPGTYKLTLQFADGFHLSYGRDMGASLTVTVR